MDKVGVIALIIGIVLCVLGVYGIWAFLPEVIYVIKGLVGIVVLLIGLMLAIFGLLIVKD